MAQNRFTCRFSYKSTKKLKNLQTKAANARGICKCELFFVPLHCISTNGVLKIMKFAIRWTLAFIIFTLALICSACNVTRTITTTSTAYQRGDTSVIIQTKTTETYDGTLKYNH